MRKPVINPGIINRLKMLFAIVQDGDTATRNIAKGKCVIWKNTPCRAITDISTGDTLSSVNLSTDDEGYINSVENNISNLQDGIAIVANNNTHPSVSLGQFVYVKNHDTLAEGLYKASSNIAVTDPLSTSNLVADNSGGLNALKSDIDTLSSKITNDFGKVLWTNPSPSSNFADGDLSVPNITNYRIVLIQYLPNKSVPEGYSLTYTAFVGQQGELANSDTSGAYFRLFTTYNNNDKINFQQGGKSGVGFDNQYIIPFKIVGII